MSNISGLSTIEAQQRIEQYGPIHCPFRKTGLQNLFCANLVGFLIYY